MPKFPFNYCIFLAMLLCPMISFNLNLQQSLVVSLTILLVVGCSFFVIFLVQQLMSTQMSSILYMLISTGLFLIVKLVLKSQFQAIYELIYFNFDFILIPVLLCGVLINYILDDKNAVKLHKQFFGCLGILLLNVVSYCALGFTRELLACGTIWGQYVTSYANNFFASSTFSLLYIVFIYGTINSLIVYHKKSKNRFNLYVEKMEHNLKTGRSFK